MLSRLMRGCVTANKFRHLQRNNSLQIASIHVTKSLRHGEYEWQDPKSEDEVVNIVYIDKDGKKVKVRGKVGDNILYLAHRYEVPMEGACEASLACTTCHVYIPNEFLDHLPASEEKEDDLLDMAPFLKENSRLANSIGLIPKRGLSLETGSVPELTLPASIFPQSYNLNVFKNRVNRFLLGKRATSSTSPSLSIRLSNSPHKRVGRHGGAVT